MRRRGRRARRRGGRHGPQGDRPRALRRPVPPGRRLSLRHLHPGGSGDPSPATRPGRPRAHHGAGRSASRSRRSPSSPTSTACTRSPQVFDGFFVHSRGGSGFPVLAPGEGTADIARLPRRHARPSSAPTLDVPVFVVQAENDVVGILGSPWPASPTATRFRLWEVAGTAHADLHLIGESTAAAGRLRRADQRRADARRGQGRVPPPRRLGGVGHRAAVRRACSR